MKQLIMRCVQSIVIAIVISLLFAILMTAITPIISTDIALGQLNNDNLSWVAMHGWSMLVFALSIGFNIIVWFICLLNVARHVIRYIKNRKD